MSSNLEIITKADILTQVVSPNRPGLSPESARSILDLKFGRDAVDRMRELTDKNNQGAITNDEQAEMEKYRRVGQFLDLMQAKARVSLNKFDSTA